MCSSLSLDIINFRDNDVVNYSLILIKGVVNSEFSPLSASEEVECNCNGSKANWPIVNSNFRCLVALSEGKNKLQFNCRNLTKNIFIEFRKRNSEYCVFPIYIVFNDNDCNGNEYLDNSKIETRSRISFCAKLLQCFYAEKLYENGFGHKTFQLIEDLSEKHHTCNLFKSKLSLEKARSLSSECLWETVGREIMNSDVGNPRYKYLGVAFLSSVGDEDLQTTDLALGSGGLALIDSHPVFTWPNDVSQVLACFKDQTPLSPPLCYNVWYKGTRGGCCSASIGSLCHELGHTFDLGHPHSGIMSTDFHLFHSAFIPVPINLRPQTTTFDLHFIPDITEISSKPNKTKVTKLKKPLIPTKQLKKIVDESSFTPGCVSILSHHKWFNDLDYHFKIEFDYSRVHLQSKAGLKVVQLRGENGKVIKSWELTGEKTEHMILPRSQACLTVFAMDNYGNISRFTFNDQVI